MRPVGEVVREEAGEGRRSPLGVEDVARDDGTTSRRCRRHTGATGRGPAAAGEVDARAAHASRRATELFVRLGQLIAPPVSMSLRKTCRAPASAAAIPAMPRPVPSF